MSRYRFFMLAFAASFCWYWLPDLIFPALGYFTWVCWIAPDNAVVNQIFGMNSGIGLLPITFDCKLHIPTYHTPLQSNAHCREPNRLRRLALGRAYVGYSKRPSISDPLDLHCLSGPLLHQHLGQCLFAYPKQLYLRQSRQSVQRQPCYRQARRICVQ